MNARAIARAIRAIAALTTWSCYMTYRFPLILSATAVFLGSGAAVFAAGTHPVTGEALSDNQSFTYRMSDDLKTLDPQLNEETLGFHAIRDLFEGLLSQDGDGNLVPGVAQSYAASNGNKTYTFTLRPDAKWSNGDPVTAHDFVYGWQRAVDPATASPYGWYLELTSIVNSKAVLAGDMPPSELGVKALDDLTFEVQLEAPLPYFPAMTTYATLFPAHRATIEAHADAWTKVGNIVSNGAYALSERVIGEKLVRVKTPTYWGAEDVIVDKVTGLVINDSDQALTRYKAGELDYMDDLPAGQYPSLKAELPDEATSVPRLCSYYYAFNMTETGHPALQNADVRKAMSMAIDRNVIVDQVLKGGQTPAYNFAHYATAGFTMPDIAYGKLTQAERDAQAIALMAGAGYGKDNPIDVKLIYNTSESHKKIATVLAQMWKQKLGVNVELANFEWKTYIDIRGNQEFDLARSAWCGDYNEASTFLDLVTTTHGANDGKYSNPRVDALMAASKTAADPQPMYTEVEQILADDMGIAPIYHYANTFLLKSDFMGWPLNNVENNWYSKNHYRVAR
jgi:oligopeptide transport system substrate-binding protein